jgi:hypothetical protein
MSNHRYRVVDNKYNRTLFPELVGRTFNRPHPHLETTKVRVDRVPGMSRLQRIVTECAPIRTAAN